MGGRCRAAPMSELVFWVFTCCEREVGGLVDVLLPAMLDTEGWVMGASWRRR